ncbi:HAD family hydrolase, partial [Kaarinaea lacus]
QQWMDEHGHSLKDSWFYSDSHNDIPLLMKVTHPIAVDPDAELKKHATQRGWKIISLHNHT